MHKNQYLYHFFDKNHPIDDMVFNISKTNRVKQVHGAEVVTIDAPIKKWIEADAIVTKQANLPIGVLTADCVPVLLYGEGVIAAVHAGWKGALNGVLDNTIKEMKSAAPNAITAIIGPCIGQQSYEVSVGFEAPFIDQHSEAAQFFTSGRLGKHHFNLADYCQFRLKLLGLKTIHIDGTDTFTSDNHYSYRGGAESHQRNLSTIMITA